MDDDKICIFTSPAKGQGAAAAAAAQAASPAAAATASVSAAASPPPPAAGGGRHRGTGIGRRKAAKPSLAAAAFNSVRALSFAFALA